MDALGALGSFFASPGGKGIESLASLGLTGAGLAGNLSAEHQQQQELNYLKQQQGAIPDATTLAADVSKATLPLNRGLTETLTNNVQGTLAESGLSQAPGILATSLTQAEAPFIQKNQATALQLVLERLGIPIQYAQAILGNKAQPNNLAPLLAMLSRTGTPGSPTAGAPSPSIQQMLSLFNSNQTPTAPSSALPDWLTSPGDMGDFGVPSQVSA